jgi:hypothetical protein
MDSSRAGTRDSLTIPAQEPFGRARVSWCEAGAFAPHDMEDAADL